MLYHDVVTAYVPLVAVFCVLALAGSWGKRSSERRVRLV